MELRYVILYVESVADAMAFYEAAFGLERAFLHESGDYGELKTGDTKLAFSAVSLMRSLGKDPAPADIKRPTFEIAFETDDVPTSLDKAQRAGAVVVQAATDMPWGQTVSYVADPSGYLVEICTPVMAPSQS